jgi:hypothetical protein
MTSQNSQPTSLDSLTLEQLQDEIRQEMCEIMKKSKLSKVLEKYGISEKKVLKIQCSIDLTKTELSDTNGSFLSPDKNNEIVIMRCCLDENEGCVKC